VPLPPASLSWPAAAHALRKEVDTIDRSVRY
jgi:hypothetical protein